MSKKVNVEQHWKKFYRLNNILLYNMDLLPI